MEKHRHSMITSFIVIQSEEDSGFFQGRFPLVGLSHHLTSPQSHQVLFVTKAKHITIRAMFPGSSQVSSGVKILPQVTQVTSHL